MTGSVFANLASREDPPFVGTSTTNAFYIKAEAMGAPYMDGGSGARRKANSAVRRKTLCLLAAKLALWPRSYCSS